MYSGGEQNPIIQGMRDLAAGFQSIGGAMEKGAQRKNLKAMGEGVMEEDDSQYVGGEGGKKQAAALTMMGDPASASELRAEKKIPTSTDGLVASLLYQGMSDPHANTALQGMLPLLKSWNATKRSVTNIGAFGPKDVSNKKASALSIYAGVKMFPDKGMSYAANQATGGALGKSETDYSYEVSGWMEKNLEQLKSNIEIQYKGAPTSIKEGMLHSSLANIQAMAGQYDDMDDYRNSVADGTTQGEIPYVALSQAMSKKAIGLEGGASWKLQPNAFYTGSVLGIKPLYKETDNYTDTNKNGEPKEAPKANSSVSDDINKRLGR